MFFNINAPELATKNLPQALQYRNSPPIKDQVAELLNMGVTILVCPTCSADQGVTGADLMRGALVSNPGRLAEQLKPGTVSLSY
jgi:predicted peroxiredoxin